MSIEKGKRDGETVWCRCRRCASNTKHTVLASVSHADFYDGPDIHLWNEYDIVRCGGCDFFAFRHEESNSDYLDEHQNPELIVNTYPEAAPEKGGGAAYITDEVYAMPGIVQKIYAETLGAIRHDLPVLAGIGIRAIVDATCNDQKAAGGSLAKMIDNLVAKSLLTSKGAEILHGIRLLGNDAAHEIKAPSRRQVEAAMKVIDHLLIGAYVIPDEAKLLPKPKKKPVASGKKKYSSSKKSISNPKQSKKSGKA